MTKENSADNNIFPLSSIMEKLRQRDPDAARIIQKKAAMYQQDGYQQRQEKASENLSLQEAFSRYAKGEPLSLPSLSEPGVEKAWIKAGNNMRLAIRDYMTANHIHPKALNLTQDELKSLAFTFGKKNSCGHAPS